VIGAIGDIQEGSGFLPLNADILDQAIKAGKVRQEKGIRLFGYQTRPLHKVLEYSSDPYIPGVTGSESGAIQFLHDIGIDPKIGKQWRKWVHLSEDEKRKLATGVILKRKNEENPEDIFCNIYTICDEEPESSLREAKEFSTLLNACGRMSKGSLGIGACLGDRKAKLRAISHLSDYRKQIVSSIRWYESNRNSTIVTEEDGFKIINAGTNVMPTMIGTLTSMISKNPEVEPNTYLLGMARDDTGLTKVSLRISGHKHAKDLDLREVIRNIIDQVGGEGGGHKKAAGAQIDTKKEKEFLSVAKGVLRRYSMVERIV